MLMLFLLLKSGFQIASCFAFLRVLHLLRAPFHVRLSGCCPEFLYDSALRRPACFFRTRHRMLLVSFLSLGRNLSARFPEKIQRFLKIESQGFEELFLSPRKLFLNRKCLLSSRNERFFHDIQVFLNQEVLLLACKT